MTSDLVTRFSEEELDKCQSWSLPDVSSEKTVPSAEKEAREQKKSAADTGATPNNQLGSGAAENPNPIAEGEIVETIDVDGVSDSPLTLDQLQAITEEAEKEGFENGYEKGVSEGREAGQEAGYAEGIGKAKQTVSEQCERLQHVIDALMIPLHSEKKQLQAVMLDMVCQLAKAVVRRELQTDSSMVTELIDNAIAAIPPNTDKFTLYLNAQDIALIEEHIAQQPQHADKSIVLQADNDLLPGGCRLETHQSIVDYSVEQRMASIIDGFLQKKYASVDDVTVTTSESAPETISKPTPQKNPQEPTQAKPEMPTEANTTESKTTVQAQSEAEQAKAENTDTKPEDDNPPKEDKP